MKVITAPFNSFEFVFIPRYYDYSSLTFRVVNESSGKEITFNETVTEENGYLTAIIDFVDLELEIVNNDSLTIKVTDDKGVVYRCKAYATDQSDLENFELITVNDNIIDL